VGDSVNAATTTGVRDKEDRRSRMSRTSGIDLVLLWGNIESTCGSCTSKCGPIGGGVTSGSPASLRTFGCARLRLLRETVRIRLSISMGDGMGGTAGVASPGGRNSDDDLLGGTLTLDESTRSSEF